MRANKRNVDRGLLATCCQPYGPEHTGHFVQPQVAAHCGGDIYSRRKPLFSSFGEHTAVCGSSVRQAVARPRHRQSVCIHNIHVALVCSGPPQKRGHMWLNKVASVLGSATKTRPHVVEQSGQCARVRHKARPHVVEQSGQCARVRHKARQHVIEQSGQCARVRHKARPHVIEQSGQCARVRHKARPHVVEQSGQCARAL